MFTVAEAIEILKEAKPTAIVMLSSDEEGNSYRPANISIDDVFCDQDGEYVSCHPQDIEDGEYEGWEDEMFDAVCIW